MSEKVLDLLVGKTIERVGRDKNEHGNFWCFISLMAPSFR